MTHRQAPGSQGPAGDGEERQGRRRRAGTEPTQARSALGVRFALATVALVVFAAATVIFAVLATTSNPGGAMSSGEYGALAALCGVVAVTAVVDLTVLRHRRK
ncbi:DUF6343 family protein [Streptomyces sp. NBC_00690]|uniref:DUF6343 family protein n=1 Tax=Streptomyces sp. NBC_00690 TaxID=2975808 RepID=UPI002E29212C|nr:DUF6343 family protein [Streptomyces sp. NBC_00690]